MRRRLRRRFYWAMAVLILLGSRLVPLRQGRWFGRKFGRLAFALRSKDRRRALRNIQLSLPELSSDDHCALCKKSATMLGQNFFDMMVQERLASDDRHFVLPPREVEQFGDLGPQLECLLKSGRGLILLTAHIGCWELLGARLGCILARCGLGPLGVVTGTVHNPPVDRLLQKRRRSLGLKTMPREQGIRPLVKHLQGGGIVAFLLDQKLSDQDPAVGFFGRPAPTPDGMARIALRYGIPILPLALTWDESSGKHVINRLSVLNQGGEVVEAASDGSGSIQKLQRQCQGALESLVRRNLSQWVWFHDRWRRDDECSH